jgi:hypothetical protein
MGALFPPKSVSNWQADIIQPLAKMTTLVIELNGYPVTIHAAITSFCLCSFKDKTPHFVIWSTIDEIEFQSMRSSAVPSTPQQKQLVPFSRL